MGESHISEDRFVIPVMTLGCPDRDTADRYQARRPRQASTAITAMHFPEITRDRSLWTDRGQLENSGKNRKKLENQEELPVDVSEVSIWWVHRKHTRTWYVGSNGEKNNDPWFPMKGLLKNHYDLRNGRSSFRLSSSSISKMNLP